MVHLHDGSLEIDQIALCPNTPGIQRGNRAVQAEPRHFFGMRNPPLFNTCDIHLPARRGDVHARCGGNVHRTGNAFGQIASQGVSDIAGGGQVHITCNGFFDIASHGVIHCAGNRAGVIAGLGGVASAGDGIRDIARDRMSDLAGDGSGQIAGQGVGDIARHGTRHITGMSSGLLAFYGFNQIPDDRTYDAAIKCLGFQILHRCRAGCHDAQGIVACDHSSPVTVDGMGFITLDFRIQIALGMQPDTLLSGSVLEHEGVGVAGITVFGTT